MNNMTTLFTHLQGFSLILLTTLSCLNTAQAAQTIDQTWPIDQKSDVKIVIKSGDIHVLSHNKPQMHIVGDLGSDSEPYKVETSGNDVEFKLNSSQPRRGKADTILTIYLPKTVEIHFEGTNVDLVIEDFSHETRVEITNGDIQAKDLTGEVELETVNGDISGSNLQGEISYTTINGDISDKNSTGKKLELASINGKMTSQSSINDISIESVNLDASFDFKHIKELEMSMVDGDVLLNIHQFSHNAEVEITSVNGDISLRLPANTALDANIELHAGGKLKNAFSQHQLQSQELGSAKILEFSIGKGDVELEINSVHGNVNLLKN